MPSFDNFTVSSGTNLTDVNVQGISSKALDGLYKALQAQAQELRNVRRDLGSVRSSMDDSRDESNRNDKSQYVQSVASERRQRAANAAVFDKIDKGFDAIGTLQTALVGALSKLGGIIADGFRDSLKSFSDLSKTMREQKLSSAQKSMVSNAVSSAVARQNAYGVNVSRGTATEGFEQLIRLGLVSSIDKMSSDMKDGYLALIDAGMDAQEAYAKATTLSKEQMQKLVYAQSDSTVKGTLNALMSQVKNTDAQVYGGASEAMNKMVDIATQLSVNTGRYLSESSRADLAKTFLDLQHGNIAGMDQKAVENALAVFGSSLKDIKSMTPEQISEAINKRISEAGGDKEKMKQISASLNILSKGQIGDDKILQEMQLGLQQVQNGFDTKLTARGKEENAEALSDSTKNGKLSQGIDSLVSKFDTLTGGALSDLSNGLDEYFGSSLSMEEIVSGGFKLVVSLLGGLLLSDIIKKGFSGLSSVITGALSLVGIGNGVGSFLDTADDVADAADLADGGKNKKGGRSGKKRFRVRGKGKAGKLASVAKGLTQAGSKATGAAAKVGTSALKTGAKAVGKVALKGIPVVGAIAGAGMVAYDFYDAATFKPEDIATEYNSDAFREEEKKLQKEQKNAKLAGATLKAGALLAGAAAGAKMGAVIGTAIPIPVVGTAIGTVVGGAIGATAGVVVDHFVEASNDLKDTELKVKSIDDLDAKIASLNKQISRVTDEGIKNQLIALRDNTKAQRDALVQKLNEKEKAHWQKMTEGTTSQDVIDSIRASLEEADKKYDEVGEKIKFLNEKKRASIESDSSLTAADKEAALTLLEDEIKTAESEQARWKDQLINSRLALEKSINTNLTDKYGTSNVGELLEKIREDRGNQDWQWNQKSFEAQIQEKLLDQLDEGTGANDIRHHLAKLSNEQAYAFLSDRAKDAGMLSQDKIDEFVKAAIKATVEESGGDTAKKLEEFENWLKAKKADEAKLQKAQLDEAKKGNQIAEQPTDINLSKMASGSVVNSATPALVGEAGKEAVVPLERPDDMKRVLNSLNPYEKFNLLKALISKSAGNITWDILADVLLNILGIGKSGTIGYGKVNATELSNKIIEGAAAQKGHSYTEMVCNQMVEAALKYAGFKPPITGVVTKHFNHPNMHLVLNDPVNGISPNDPALVPGMIMFSHPFTQAEADQLNKQKGGRRKAGDPGHMGIYAGNGLWWNSTSSKKFKDYSTGKAIDSTASGVALTKPFTTGTYKLYAAGYYDGMFDGAESLPTAPTPSSSMINTLNQTANKNTSDLTTNVKSAVKKAGLLSDEELESLAKEAGIQNASAMSEFVKQAELILNSNKDKDSIVSILLDIAKYLRGAVQPPRQPMMSVARPAMSTYN